MSKLFNRDSLILYRFCFNKTILIRYLSLSDTGIKYLPKRYQKALQNTRYKFLLISFTRVGII
jgi:hypothetical protein